jgi:hypothetical protein
MRSYFVHLFGVYLLATGCLFAQSSLIKDCNAALSKDYYSYAQQNNLEEDYLRTIDRDTWQKMQEDHSSSGSAGYGGFTLNYGDSYDKFSESREHYFDSTHYHRNNQQALNILQITTSPRAYAAYETCLRSFSQGPAIVAWASSESMSEVQVRVKYVNGPGIAGAYLYGTVTGGSVKGESAGLLWGTPTVASHFSFLSSSLDPNYWKGNEEKLIVIQRTRGFAETSIAIKSSRNEPPVSLKFERADGILTLTYEGQRDVLRRQNVQGPSVGLPNNNENRGSCPNEVGRENGVCVSRTAVTVSTASPKYLQNPRTVCSGYPCGWARIAQASLSGDQLSATGYVDNWGSSAIAYAVGDEYEHLGKSQCGADEKLPVIKGQPILFSSVTEECLPIALLKWKLLGDDTSEGSVRFGYQYGPHNEVERATFDDNGSVVVASYKLLK